jgi:hypothetical protein
MEFVMSKVFQFVCQIAFLVLRASPFVAFVSDTYLKFVMGRLDGLRG